MLKFIRILVLVLLPIFLVAGDELTLLDAENLALKNNRDLQVLNEQLEVQNTVFLQSVSGLLPKAGVTAKCIKSDFSSSSVVPYMASLNIDQTVFSTESYYHIVDQKLAVEEFVEKIRSFHNDLIYQVRCAYYGVVLAQEQLNVAQKKVGLLEDDLEFEKCRFEVGETTLLHVQHSKVSLSNAVSTYQTAVRDLKKKRCDVMKLLGLRLEDEPYLQLNESRINVMGISELREKISACQAEKDIIEDTEQDFWGNMALGMLPSIKRQDIAVERSRRTVNRGWGKYLPVVSVFANYAGYGTSSFSDADYNWGVGLKFSWDLFDGLKREFGIKGARHRLLAEQEGLNKIKEDAKIDVYNSLFDVKRGVLSYISANEGVKNAEAMMQQAEQVLELGSITSLEYREFVNSYINACHNLNGASYELLCAYYGLRHEAGIDVKNEEL
jgi:outer membrane protein